MAYKRVFCFAHLLMLQLRYCELFDIINQFTEENCTGICTNGAQSMSG